MAGRVVVTAIVFCEHPGMSTEQAHKASPTKQERLGLVAGIVIMAVAVVVLLTASTPREVVSSCLVLSVGALLTLTRWERRGRAVRVVMVVLAAVAVALAVVGIAVL